MSKQEEYRRKPTLYARMKGATKRLTWTFDDGLWHSERHWGVQSHCGGDLLVVDREASDPESLVIYDQEQDSPPRRSNERHPSN